MANIGQPAVRASRTGDGLKREHHTGVARRAHQSEHREGRRALRANLQRRHRAHPLHAEEIPNRIESFRDTPQQAGRQHRRMIAQDGHHQPQQYDSSHRTDAEKHLRADNARENFTQPGFGLAAPRDHAGRGKLKPEFDHQHGAHRQALKDGHQSPAAGPEYARQVWNGDQRKNLAEKLDAHQRENVPDQSLLDKFAEHFHRALDHPALCEVSSTTPYSGSTSPADSRARRWRDSSAIPRLSISP
jgi:hypothetical protein